MKASRRIVIIVVSALCLVVGVVLGFLPVKATLTQIAPELRLITVPCGNGYLPATPPGDLIAVPGESGVGLPRVSYTEHCADAAGWQRYGAWGLTALGVLGLALVYSATRTPRMPGERRSRRTAPRRKPAGTRVAAVSVDGANVDGVDVDGADPAEVSDNGRDDRWDDRADGRKDEAPAAAGQHGHNKSGDAA